MSTACPISETVSKKRGRPRAFDVLWLTQLKALFPEITTGRQLTARAYELRALSDLREGDRGIIVGVDQIINLDDGTHRSTVLEQLGRLKVEFGCDMDDLRVVARAVNKRMANERLTARDAVSMIKSIRFLGPKADWS